MGLDASHKLTESPAAILLRVQQVAGSKARPDTVSELVGDCDSLDASINRGEELDEEIVESGAPHGLTDRERRGLGERTTLRMKAMQRRATEGIVSRITPRRLVGWAAVAMVLAGAGMIGMGVKNRLSERTASSIDGIDGEGFSETVVPGASYVRMPGPDLPRPTGEFATLSDASDVPSSGMIQAAAFHTSNPRGAWLEGTIEEDSEPAEGVSHEQTGPRLR